MDRETLFKVLKNNISTLTLDELVAEFITKTQAIEEFYKLCNGISAGKTISLLFNPHRLSTDTDKDDLSVFESLSYDDKLSGLARLYLYNLEHGVNNAFYNTIQRGYQNIQYVNEFPPYIARIIYQQWYNGDRLRIFDPCCGWGGRMIGAASLLNVEYEGCEPSTKTYNGLVKLSKWLSDLQPTFSAKVNCIPFEDYVATKEFDIALTSPPYYDTEHYSDELTNSMNRYNSFDEWVEKFYTKLILNTVALLKKDGVFILNVGDRKYPLSDTLFTICKDNGLCCERIKDYLSGNGDGKEKFYCVSKVRKGIVKRSLF